MTAELTFVDTNVLVYAYDTTAGAKHDASRDLVSRLWRSRQAALSTQVLQEFYVTVTRRLPEPLPRTRARQLVRRYASWQVHAVEPSDLLDASELEQRHSVSFWDALIVRAAIRVVATRLLTEDLQDGRRFGDLVVVNPFR